MNKKVWLFIDIDGCIMDNMFENSKFYENDLEKIENIIQAYEKAKTTKLYPEFIDWYVRTVDNKEKIIKEIVFTTGRQADIFGWITKTQLKFLREFHPFTTLYFNENLIHTWELYKKFKLYCLQKFTIHPEDKIEIYDDTDFSEEYKKVLKKNFEFHLIQDKEDWNKL